MSPVRRIKEMSDKPKYYTWEEWFEYFRLNLDTSIHGEGYESNDLKAALHANEPTIKWQDERINYLEKVLKQKTDAGQKYYEETVAVWEENKEMKQQIAQLKQAVRILDELPKDAKTDTDTTVIAAREIIKGESK